MSDDSILFIFLLLFLFAYYFIITIFFILVLSFIAYDKGVPFAIRTINMFVQSNIFPAEEVSRWSTKQNVDNLLSIVEDQKDSPSLTSSLGMMSIFYLLLNLAYAYA